VLSGLPPLVREGDRFSAMLTLRNTTAREMKVRATLQGTANSGSGAEITRTPLNFPPQDVARRRRGEGGQWPVDVPAEAFSIVWEAAVEEQGGPPRRTASRSRSSSAAAVPVRVLQATLRSSTAAFSLPVAAPPMRCRSQGVKRGGLRSACSPS
jgi:hypothetical protein